MKEKELKLDIEELEERIAPSFIFTDGSAPEDAHDIAGRDPAGGQGGLGASFGPNSGLHPTGDAWIAHQGASPLDNGGNN